jgi:hypothetical protein
MITLGVGDCSVTKGQHRKAGCPAIDIRLPLAKKIYPHCECGMRDGKRKARVPQVRRCYVPKHGVRCRSCTSQPAISEVVTRDGLELYNHGYRSSMTAFGAVLRGTGRGTLRGWVVGIS